jgi:RNA recognition motif-containing protein
MYFFFFCKVFLIMGTNIYVGNLSYNSNEQGLSELFEQYGTVHSAKVIEDRETGRSRGFGFVEMDAEGAAAAIEALNGAELDGRALRVNEARPREARPPRRW